jgi:hypothetical protein
LTSFRAKMPISFNMWIFVSWSNASIKSHAHNPWSWTCCSTLSVVSHQCPCLM